MDAISVLPYRTDSLALAQWVEARARGRSAEQLRGAVNSPKGVEGTAAAAAALGFVDPLEGALTPEGERFALAESVERRRLLREAMLRYPPYRDMLEGLAQRGAPAETEVRWIEAWWATRGYGSSESNRREGAAAFGRLGEFAGLGEYVPGRRGHPTRIRWTPGALSARGNGGPRLTSEERVAPNRDAARPAPVAAAPRGREARGEPDPDLFSAPPGEPTPASAAPSPPSGVARLPVPESESSALTPPVPEMNRIAVPLAGELLARIEVPLRLPRAEKRRLLELLQLLIVED